MNWPRATVALMTTIVAVFASLKFFDGLPGEETVRKVYDNLDFGGGVVSHIVPH